ncbi:rod shape-determining protein MreD [Gracilimonas sediminicola]|uniref:Rod shape-determining protein MreD n=1 Tax=Gracilimonas sediminicola TaxID=2952158 RepID=A0A9X2L438_9BACT|nr:rod shape-determining protein MreD [Gracilimonas sediminicola]MCP9292005.1 rod shape-determining protein MreD [Gracilimonas sediminicola]
MSAETLKDFFIGLCFILAEVLIFQHLSLFGTTPDPLILYLLWLAMKYDRIKLVLFAASLGLVQDALFDFWGLHMFAKTLMCFAFFNFVNQRKEGRLLLWQIFLVITAAAVFHNLIFLGLSSFIEAYTTGFSPIIFTLGNSLYTALLGAMLFIFKGN